MKFFQIATASFLAGNAVVAAYEIPSDNLIAELADEYNAELSNFLDFDEAKCDSEGEGIELCISGKLGEDAEWASSMEKAAAPVEPCVMEAKAKGDAEKIVKCVVPFLDITDKKCPTTAFREACGLAPSMFEDFVLNLVEVLEDAAVWEDEEDMDFYDKATCESEFEKASECLDETVAKAEKDADIKEWVKSLEKAKKAAETCVTKAGDSTAAKLKCLSNAFKIANQYCSTAAFVKACKDAPSSLDLERVKPEIMFEDFASSSSADGYGLRGSSFDEE